ncbi:MAG: hypothetical protein V8Q42_01865 [Anaerovoracaceae bacterium]
MNYIFGFEGIRQIEESMHSLPHKLTVTALDDRFIFVGREEYIFLSRRITRSFQVT